MKKANTSMIKLMNRELIIHELKENPRQSRAELAKKTKLSKPAVSEIVKELIEEGIILEVGFGESTGGKKPILLEYNARSNYVIGILIENDTIFIALGDMNGEIVQLIRKTYTAPIAGEVVVRMIVEGVFELLRSENINARSVLGMAIGVAGIQSDDDTIISTSPSVDWGNLDLQKEIYDQTSIDVIIENDVNLMTIGEFHKGEGIGIDNFVYLFVGNGIGSGLFLNGQFYKGHHSAAGEIGFMMIGDETRSKPNFGVFEANYGRLGLINRLQELNISIDKIDKERSFVKFLQENKNDRIIGALLDETVEQWAKAIINMISMIDPEVIIFSGELKHLDVASYQQLISIIEKYVPKIPEFKKTKLGAKAGLYGAFNLVLKKNHITGFKQYKP